MFHLLGIYNYTVILTEISLLCAVVGISQAISGNTWVSLLCLALCGIFDAFDGRIARTKTDRSEEEKNFGIQLDSLCDLVCFGVLPGIICYQNGVNCLLVGLFCVAAMIRLAWFNVLEWQRQQYETGGRTTYRGLPVTSISGFLLLGFFIASLLPDMWMSAILSATLAIIGFLFILDFQFKKPDLKEIMLMIAGMGILLGVLLLLAMRRGGIIS